MKKRIITLALFVASITGALVIRNNKIEENNKALIEEVTLLSTELNDEYTKRLEILKLITDIELLINEKNDEISSLTELKVKYELELEESARVIEVKNTRIEVLENKLFNLKIQYNELLRKYSALKHENNALRERAEKAESEFKLIKEANEILQKEVNDLKDKLSNITIPDLVWPIFDKVKAQLANGELVIINPNFFSISNGKYDWNYGSTSERIQMYAINGKVYMYRTQNSSAAVAQLKRELGYGTTNSENNRFNWFIMGLSTINYSQVSRDAFILNKVLM